MSRREVLLRARLPLPPLSGAGAQHGLGLAATAITLTLVEPSGNGFGSDAFAIVWDGRELHG